jgi:hypothetical protein
MRLFATKFTDAGREIVWPNANTATRRNGDQHRGRNQTEADQCRQP